MKGTGPFEQFRAWFEKAKTKELNDPNAMALATVRSDGAPNVRIVLMKGFDERGFVFFTNTKSAKGQELKATRKAALSFHWKSLRRQVRVRGIVEAVSKKESDDYFASRPRGSQVGALASLQSRPLKSRTMLEKAVKAIEKKYPRKVLRPPHWSGFRVVPLEMEFWENRPSRLHERTLYSRKAKGRAWKKALLYP